MILTVTANPSVDRTIAVDALVRGALIRSRRSWTEPSGKGVNVAIALHRQGVEVAAVVPLGGPSGDHLRRQLDETGVRVHEVAIGGEIRSNVSVIEPDGTVTKINDAGPQLSAAEVEALVGVVADHLDGADWLACCGSLPAGVPVDLYARLAELGRSRGVRVAIDSSGEPLRSGLRGRPDLVKPNVHELAELVRRPLTTLGDAVEAAHEVLALGASSVLASLGADGLLLIDAAGAVHAEAPVPAIASAVGAGDAALAGYLSVAGTGPDRVAALRAAAAWGAAAVHHPGTLLPAVSVDQRVTVHAHVDAARKLLEPAIAANT